VTPDEWSRDGRPWLRLPAEGGGGVVDVHLSLIGDIEGRSVIDGGPDDGETEGNDAVVRAGKTLVKRGVCRNRSFDL
jgi:hypothetical protein